MDRIKCDFLVLAGHKFYGPRIGALYMRNREDLTPMLLGGGQESGQRSGTENTPMIVGLGAAAELVTQNLAQYALNMKTTRDLLYQLLSGKNKVTWLSG